MLPTSYHTQHKTSKPQEEHRWYINRHITNDSAVLLYNVDHVYVWLLVVNAKVNGNECLNR